MFLCPTQEGVGRYARRRHLRARHHVPALERAFRPGRSRRSCQIAQATGGQSIRAATPSSSTAAPPPSRSQACRAAIMQIVTKQFADPETCSPAAGEDLVLWAVTFTVYPERLRVARGTSCGAADADIHVHQTIVGELASLPRHVHGNLCWSRTRHADDCVCRRGDVVLANTTDRGRQSLAFRASCRPSTPLVVDKGRITTEQRAIVRRHRGAPDRRTARTINI